jgi:hypothetical protein
LQSYFSPSRFLVRKGIRALKRQDFPTAVSAYREMTGAFSFEPGSFETQTVLGYVALLRVAVRNERAPIVISFSSNQFPSVALRVGKESTHVHRVEQMIHDTLTALENGERDEAKARMEVIIQAYTSLPAQEKERLAPLYESFVYRLNESD